MDLIERAYRMKVTKRDYPENEMEIDSQLLQYRTSKINFSRISSIVRGNKKDQTDSYNQDLEALDDLSQTIAQQTEEQLA